MVQTWAQSEVTDKQNTSAPPQFLMGFLIIRSARPRESEYCFIFPGIGQAEWEICLGAFSLAYETMLLGRKIQQL